MKKITELKEVRLGTVYTTDEYGNRERDAEEYIFSRPVKSVNTDKRILHYLIDTVLIQGLIYGVDELLKSQRMSVTFESDLSASLFNLSTSLLFFIFYYAIF